MKYIFFLCLCLAGAATVNSQTIDRHALVQRHDVILTSPDTLGSLSLGNGHFCFTVDVTGLQSFPVDYQNGIPLGTESDWGWHSFPNDSMYRVEETFRHAYAAEWRQAGRNHDAAEYLRQNPHRLQLGNVGMLLYKRDGSVAGLADLKDIHQRLDLWRGEIISHFTLEGEAVDVITCSHPDEDAISFHVRSSLIKEQRLKVFVRLPYPTNKFTDFATNYEDSQRHSSKIEDSSLHGATISHTLDTTTYYIQLRYGNAVIKPEGAHYFLLSPVDSNFEMTVKFSPRTRPAEMDASGVRGGLAGLLPAFEDTRSASTIFWKGFWLSGGSVDFTGSTDPRAAELERRIVLSQYLTRIQSVGDTPPQETGLTYNSWYGRPHMEMILWHAAHFALWGRPELLEKNMRWYIRNAADARAIALRQGYAGIRWQKMTDPQGGEAPSNVGSYLIWQQPHLIYLAELLYRCHPSAATLNKYKELVFATAEFMASFPRYDSVKGCYVLGPPLIPAQECFNSATTYNPTYELAYWYWALNMAQEWRRRLKMGPDRKWARILQKLSPLPQKNGVYLATESTPDCYSPDSKYTIDHPAVLFALGFFTSPKPQNGSGSDAAAGRWSDHGLDLSVMKRTYHLIDTIWHWEHTWGWDFPMTAMTAVRLGEPAATLDALFRYAHANTWLPDGHNYQDGRLRLYLPGNGGLLAAVALMCAGYDGCGDRNPGFPTDGTWKVRWEGLRPLP